MKVSDIVIYIMKMMWWDLKRILSSRFRELRLVLRVARKKIHQNFLASKHDIDAAYKINVSYLELFLLNILSWLLKI